MISALYRWLFLATLMMAGAGAHAAITCSVSSPGFATAYDPAAAANTVVQTNFTISCNRTALDATSVNYTVAANNGLYKLGKNTNQALFVSGGINYFAAYDIYKDSGCTTQWKGGVSQFSGTFVFAVGSLTGTLNQTYYGCVFKGQNTLPAGIYSDTVTMTLNYGGSTATNSFAVQIATPSTCAISAPPSTLSFGSYVAFGSALAASTAFGANCTSFLPYTLSVSPTGGTIAGVNYTLLLNGTATTINLTGTGVQQNHTIDGSMAAGQAGTCIASACSGINAHTLTLTY